ncbi:MAG: hypothetical protein MRJ96_00890 [Nitrospirales bacterium]|nr:hypothetical protein [Nitrospira sp.]MDR4499997.1 hypothetical protein [Nitrospirales bacterium]
MRSLAIPFKQVFAHASAVRAQTESVLVMAASETGNIGIGEGCPRQYVTGEMFQTCEQFFNEYQAVWATFQNLEDINSWLETHTTEIDLNPAIWCAVELALLDLLGKESQKSIETVVGVPELQGNYQYSAVLGTDSLAAYQKQLQQFVALGFTDFKIKVTGTIADDVKKVEMLNNAHVTNVRIRLDANNLWKTSCEAIDYLHQFDCPFLGIEEPVQAGDYAGCKQIYESLGVPIILDESFLRLDQFRHLEDAPKAWIINIRISKMGGILRSLAIAEQAKRCGIPIIIGAQVGETSILSRVALTVANTFRENLLAQEGGFGTYLLEYDITDRPLMFGKNGILAVSSVENGHGHGVVCRS